MAEKQRITIRLSQRDLATIDRLRGRADRSTFMRRLLRRAGADLEPDEDFEHDGNDVVVGPERLAELNALTMDS